MKSLQEIISELELLISEKKKELDTLREEIRMLQELSIIKKLYSLEQTYSNLRSSMAPIEVKLKKLKEKEKSSLLIEDINRKYKVIVRDTFKHHSNNTSKEIHTLDEIIELCKKYDSDFRDDNSDFMMGLRYDIIFDESEKVDSQIISYCESQEVIYNREKRKLKYKPSSYSETIGIEY